MEAQQISAAHSRRLHAFRSRRDRAVELRGLAILMTLAMHALPFRHKPAALLSLAVACAVATAQTATREFREVMVVRAEQGEQLVSAPNWGKAVARGRDGAWWLLIGRSRLADADRKIEATWGVELWRSLDGMRWELGAKAPMPRASCGAIVADPTNAQLHLLLSVSTDRGWSEPWHAAYDVEKSSWIGEPTRLVEASSDEDQYFANDLECTERGDVVALVGSHRSPPQGAFDCGWSTGLRCKPRDGAEWSKLQQVNVASYGVGSNVSVRGDLIDCSYRTCPHGAITAVRTFDATKGAFVQASDEAVHGEFPHNLGVCNSSSIAVDATGGRYVVFSIGQWDAGAGRIAVAWRGPDADAWKTIDIAEDPPLKSGNESYAHFALARGAGNQMVALYGKASEDHANLYQRVLDAGELVGDEKLLMRDKPGAFAYIVGNKRGEMRPGIQLVATRMGESAQRASVAIYGVLPAPMPKLRAPK